MGINLGIGLPLYIHSGYKFISCLLTFQVSDKIPLLQQLALLPPAFLTHWQQYLISVG